MRLKFGWAIGLIVALLSGPVLAQAPTQPFYGVTSSTGAKGFQPVDSSHGLPVAARAVATCGSQSLTAGIMYPVEIDLTGTLCTSLGSGGITAAVTIANGADVAEGATTDAAATAGSTGTVSAKLRLMTSQLNTIATTGHPITGTVAVTQSTSPWVVSNGGTFATQAAQSGTWTVQPGNTANTTPWLVTGSGTAGTAASGVSTIQGIASMTPVQVSQATAANLNATVVGTGTFAVQATTQGAVNITLTDCSGTITSGGTAQNAFTANAGRHGFTIANIDTSEVLWISFTTTAAASGTGSYPLAPADATTFANLASFTSPQGMGINTALSVIAATTSHKWTCTVW